MLLFVVVVWNSFKDPSTKVENLQIETETEKVELEQVTEQPKKEIIKETEEKPAKKVEKVEEIEKNLYNQEVFQVTGIKHYKYSEANPNDLINVEGQELHKDAAKAFFAMQKAAARESIKLRVISGFRSIDRQKSIVERKKAAGQSLIQIYKVSSAPGHSEHHTGYGLDINDLNQSFEDTDAYKFLVREAEKFGFELSFPRGNHNGIAYEPWHWRFVGTPEAQKTFRPAQTEEVKKNPKKAN